MKRIGERVKRRRELLYLRLNDLAKKVGVSSSALSQIERSKAFPSILTLKSIAEHLHTTVGELIGENETLSNNPVVRRDEIKFVEKNASGTEIYLLSHHDIHKQMDTYLVRFVKGSTLEGLFTNIFAQIYCYVTSGAVQFELDDKNYTLEIGDSIYFNSKSQYNAKNDTEQLCDLLLILSPPNY
ncbi:MAG TPA: hypothetical protein DCR40_09285 [Prolixibacteraceae bacterium]|nr:hypothetical protein [Prolixibacteraceae bacterium]